MRLNTYQTPYILIDDFARNAVDDGVVMSWRIRPWTLVVGSALTKI
jgi:hypothetical protein